MSFKCTPKEVAREFVLMNERAEITGSGLDFDELNDLYGKAIRCFSIAEMKKIRREAAR
jgi:hypothetical protein